MRLCSRKNEIKTFDLKKKKANIQKNLHLKIF